MAGLSAFGPSAFRTIVSRTPILGPALRKLYHASVGRRSNLGFQSSQQYWEDRYRRGGTSGAGSYGRLATFKARTINDFVSQYGVRSVVEFGCGDGAQLKLARYPQYSGIDVSASTIDACRALFGADPTKRFFHTSGSDTDKIRADMSLSLDVVYHLVEDDIYQNYMHQLVSAADRFVCVYSSNFDGAAPEPHIRHRCFTYWFAENAPGWRQFIKIQNPYPYDRSRPSETSWADFYFFVRND